MEENKKDGRETTEESNQDVKAEKEKDEKLKQKEDEKQKEEKDGREKKEEERWNSQSLKEKLENLRSGGEETEESRFINEVFSNLMGNGNFYGNVVIANTIRESSFFKKEGVKNENEKETEKVRCLTDKKELQQFMEEKKESILKPYMLVLAALRLVEKSELDRLAEIMCTYLARDEEERFDQDRGACLSYILEQINAQEYVIEKYTAAGRVKAAAIGYSQEQSEQIRKHIWNEYLYLRKPLVRWLLDGNNTEKFPVSVLASEGLAKFSSLDFVFAQDHVIRELVKGKSVHQIGCLTEVLHEISQNPSCRKNVGKLIESWTEWEKSNAWLAGLACYLNDEGLTDGMKLKKRIGKTISGEIVFGQQNIYWYLGPLLHRNRSLGRLLYAAAGEVFEEAQIREEKREISLNLLNLMLSEIYHTRKKSQVLVLMDIANEDAVRKMTVPVWRFIWKTYELRHMLEDLLDYYFEKIEGSGESMKLFFRMLAFTGEKSDFDNAISYLERLDPGKEAKESLKKWLIDLKTNRK